MDSPGMSTCCQRLPPSRLTAAPMPLKRPPNPSDNEVFRVRWIYLDIAFLLGAIRAAPSEYIRVGEVGDRTSFECPGACLQHTRQRDWPAQESNLPQPQRLRPGGGLSQ